MSAVSIPSRRKSWRDSRERVSVLAALAIHKQTVVQKLAALREMNADPATGKPLSQERAAQRVGVTVRQWQRWESGESVPYPRNLDAIAAEFGFDVGEFFSDPEPAAEPARTEPTQLDRVEAKLDRIATFLGLEEAATSPPTLPDLLIDRAREIALAQSQSAQSKES